MHTAPNNSLTTSNVHRSLSNSIAFAIGQNWPYVDIFQNPSLQYVQ